MVKRIQLGRSFKVTLYFTILSKIEFLEEVKA